MKLPKEIRDKLPRRTRGVNPMVYAKAVDNRSGWKWFIIALEGKKPYERAYCRVHGIFTELGDVYLNEIEENAIFDETFEPKKLNELKEGVDY